MGNKSAHFNGKDKVIGCGFSPGGKNFFRGEMIKTVVKLDSAKLPDIKLQPSRFG